MTTVRPRRVPFWLVIGIALIVGLAALAWTWFDERQTPPAPDFTLTSYNGTTYRFADMRDKAIVLNFWASWCAPCRVEAPILRQTWQAMRDQNVVFLGVSQDTNTQDAADLSDAYGYPSGPDRGLSALFGVQALPTTIIIDRHGNITAQLYSTIEASDLQGRIDAALR